MVLEEGISTDLRETLNQRGSDNESQSGDLVLGDTEGHVGDTVTIRGLQLPSNAELAVVWKTVVGNWGVIQANEIKGPQYQPKEVTLTDVKTDDSGTFEETIEIPEDYGSTHPIAIRNNGSTVANAEFEIFPHFELLNDNAELGEFFTVKGYGIGPNPARNNFQVSWDLGLVGIMTGVKNNGTATASVRAVGPPGKHDILVWRGYKGVPFLQSRTQSDFGPVGSETQNEWEVTVTEPETEPAAAWSDELIPEEPLSVHYPSIDRDTEATLTIAPNSGPPGTEAMISGKRFPENKSVNLVWHRHDGKRINGKTITPKPQPDKLPTVETDDDGTFEKEVEIPPDRGATRPIVAEVSGESVAVTGFIMQPKITEFSPTSGPQDTEIDIKISGTGWTLYENANFVVYDNKMLGYFCGNCDNGEDGIVHLNLPVSGGPGYHFIDIYPTLFETEKDGHGFECKPHLSYLDNHPIRPLPAHHFAFKITE
ncbi:hypothetical protein [Halodesulfurarchaeum sp.]|uniref:hypothetical protein n=1 Tax=Halodesulfurarchaeum sp. TaxID=1980530 RepID=UPI002FC36737